MIFTVYVLHERGIVTNNADRHRSFTRHPEHVGWWPAVDSTVRRVTGNRRAWRRTARLDSSDGSTATYEANYVMNVRGDMRGHIFDDVATVWVVVV